MSIHKEYLGPILVLSFDEYEELRDPAEFADLLQREISDGRLYLLIDMKDVIYLSSAILGSIITSLKVLREKEGHIKLVNVQPCVSNVLEMTRVVRVVEIYNDKETALRSFNVLFS